jgi:hypothetical protein
MIVSEILKENAADELINTLLAKQKELSKKEPVKEPVATNTVSMAIDGDLKAGIQAGMANSTAQKGYYLVLAAINKRAKTLAAQAGLDHAGQMDLYQKKKAEVGQMVKDHIIKKYLKGQGSGTLKAIIGTYFEMKGRQGYS